MKDIFYRFILPTMFVIINLSCESTLTPKHKINRQRVIAIQADPTEFIATEDDLKNPSYPTHTLLRALAVDPDNVNGDTIHYHWESMLSEFSDFVHGESKNLFLDFSNENNNSVNPFNPKSASDSAKKNLSLVPKNTLLQIPIQLQIRDENSQLVETAIKSLYFTLLDKEKKPSQKKCSVALDELAVELESANNDTSSITTFKQEKEYSFASLRKPDIFSENIQKNARYILTVKKFFRFWSWDKNDNTCQNINDNIKIEWYATHGKFETTKNRFEKIWIASQEENDATSDTVQLILVMRDPSGASDWWHLYGTFEK